MHNTQTFQRVFYVKLCIINMFEILHYIQFIHYTQILHKIFASHSGNNVIPKSNFKISRRMAMSAKDKQTYATLCALLALKQGFIGSALAFVG